MRVGGLSFFCKYRIHLGKKDAEKEKGRKNKGGVLLGVRLVNECVWMFLFLRTCVCVGILQRNI